MSPIVYIGNTCIILGIGFALFGIISFSVARRVGSETSAALGRGTLYANFILMTVANYAMVYALLGNDFGVSYVAHVGSRETPRWISAISLWSSLEGSILFWGWVLSAYAAVCAYVYREKKEKLLPWVGLTFLSVQIFFFVLLALLANPFQPVTPVPENGPGPNPLLQNHWLMAAHPPSLYIGYIGFTVPFAFAVAALIEKDLQGLWVGMARRWTLFAWSFLTIAIVLGGWWSYAVLGWGGYWAWDPVENASFMPWLSGTALVHSLIVQEKRRLLPVWNLILAVVTFLLTLLGTFLTRSGILDSVHSFTESTIGPFFLFFIGMVLAVSLWLLIWKGSSFRDPSNGSKVENLFSLEVLFLFNNLLFVSFCFVVFLGTLYPLVVEAVSGGRISVGEPYFNQMTVPLAVMILFLMGVSLLTPWRKGNFRALLKEALLPLILAVVVTGAAFLLGMRRPWVVATLFFASFAFFVMGVEVRQTHGRNLRRTAGFVSHIGVLIVMVAIALSSAYESAHEVTLKRGESTEVKDYTLTLREMTGEETPQRFEIKGVVDVFRGGKLLDTLTPQMNFYPASREPIGSPAVRSTASSDLYLTLVSFEKDGTAASLRVIWTPAVVWLWIGGGIVMLGGFLALSFGSNKNKEMG